MLGLYQKALPENDITKVLHKCRFNNKCIWLNLND